MALFCGGAGIYTIMLAIAWMKKRISDKDIIASPLVTSFFSFSYEFVLSFSCQLHLRLMKNASDHQIKSVYL